MDAKDGFVPPGRIRFIVRLQTTEDVQIVSKPEVLGLLSLIRLQRSLGIIESYRRKYDDSAAQRSDR